MNANNTKNLASPRRALAVTVAIAALTVGAFGQATAAGPGRGATARFEKAYLMFIIDHHYSALRMTELAAGTDPHRDAAVVNPTEGTAPTPNFSSTVAKATDDEIRSMARMANRTQREEIGKAQDFLKDWYGVRHEPQLNDEGQRMIAMLERLPAGAGFNEAFLRSFATHHASALAPSLHCEVRSDLAHEGLRRYCENILLPRQTASTTCVKYCASNMAIAGSFRSPATNARTLTERALLRRARQGHASCLGQIALLDRRSGGDELWERRDGLGEQLITPNRTLCCPRLMTASRRTITSFLHRSSLCKS